MAVFDVLVWRVTTSYSGSWNSNMGSLSIDADDYIHVRLDDATGELTAVLTSASGEGAGTTYGTLTEGPNLFFGYGGAATLLTVSPYYKYCEGTALRMVGTSSLHPYGSLSYNAGHAECAIVPVCDLDIASVPVITDATGPTNADGAVTVSATSSNGTIKYAINNPGFNYASEGQTSPTFSGLLPGDYTITAKDAAACTDQISVSIPITETYGVRYRIDFVDSLSESSRTNRIDILKRAYTGEISEYDYGPSPIKVRWNGNSNEPDQAIIPCQAILSVMRTVVGQYDELFTDDDRLFKVQHYVSSNLYYSGYIAPEFSSEPFIKEPYPLELTVVDGLAELKDADFTDESGNTYKGEMSTIAVIAECLKKTDLKFNINCGVNVFEQDMDTTAADDPFAQAFIDVRIFEDLKCYDVLTRILEPLRAQIQQADGAWWIARISDSAGTFSYRTFDYLGEYVSNSTIDTVQGLRFPTQANRACWVGKTQYLSHARNYGYFSITHDAARDNNLIDEGRFEPEDIIAMGGGTYSFKNFNFFLGQPGTSYGFEYVKNGDSKGAALISYRSTSGAQNDSKLYSIQVPLSRFSGGYLRAQFQYMIRPNYVGLPYIRLGWSLRIFNSYETIWMSPSFPPDFSRSSDQEIINELYVTSFGSWANFEVTARQMFPGTAEDDQMYMEVTFYTHNHYGRDFANITALKAFSISAQEIKIGRKVMVVDGSVTRQYVSVASTDAESLPEKVRPTSYAGDYLWEQEKVINLPGGTSLVADFLLDNLSVSLFPQGIVNGQTAFIEPPEEVIYSQEVSTFVKSNLNKKVYLGDMPIFDDTNVDVVHYNNENLIYRGWFRDADGNPTYRWARAGVTESKKLLQILLEDLRDQYSTPKRKLSGTFASDIVWNFLNSAQEEFEGSRYKFMTMEFNAKRAEYTVELIQVTTGEGGEPPVVRGSFKKNAFTTGFEIGE